MKIAKYVNVLSLLTIQQCSPQKIVSFEIRAGLSTRHYRTVRRPRSTVVFGNRENLY